MSIQISSMGWKIFLVVCLVMLISLSPVSAIPESDLYKFTGAGRFAFNFDFFHNSTSPRTAIIRHLTNITSQYYYVVVRANAGDVAPYDEFDLSFICNDDESETALTTTGYNSWVQSGQISFKHELKSAEVVYYSGFLPYFAMDGECNITSAGSLLPDGNTGYTTFNLELVPLQDSDVQTVQAYCEDEARTDLIEAEISGILSVVENNVNIFYTLWIVIQIVAMLFLVVGIPTVMLLMIRWSIFKVTGRKLFARREK